MLQGDNVTVIPGPTKDYVIVYRHRKPKAADISDKAILAAIRNVQKERRFRHQLPGDPPVSIWDIQAYMNMWPRKVVRAKLASMVRRNVITGCIHSGTDCRGDFEIVEK